MAMWRSGWKTAAPLEMQTASGAAAGTWTTLLAGKGVRGSESPMLHQILISELALQRAECQEFERLTTKLTTCSSRSLVVKLGEIPPFSNSKLGTGGANGTFRAS